MTTTEVADLLKAHGLRVTPQRIAVYQYLDEHRTHAQADTIYETLVRQYPSFSRTTIYNSIRALEEGGLIQPVIIDGTVIRYDANTNMHGHFKCTDCGMVYDVMDSPELAVPPSLQKFDTQSCVMNFYGKCPECRVKKSDARLDEVI